MSRILVVEDDPALRRALAINLKARGYSVETAGDGASALHFVARNSVDLIILDLGLPDIDGVDVVNGLRGWNSVPILVLSARDRQRDKVAALDAGADDYVTKPFGMEELLARARAALRRSLPAGNREAVVTAGAISIDLAARRVRRDGSEVRLTPTEWHLLETLVQHRGKLVSQRQLLTQVWGPAYAAQTNYLRVYIAQLRRKLEDDPSHPVVLRTDPGMGYRFDADAGAEF